MTPLGNSDLMVIVDAGQGIGDTSAGSLEVTMVDPKGAKAATDSTKVRPRM
jgi:hypothetical protein